MTEKMEHKTFVFYLGSGNALTLWDTFDDRLKAIQALRKVDYMKRTPLYIVDGMRFEKADVEIDFRKGIE